MNWTHIVAFVGGIIFTIGALALYVYLINREIKKM